MVLRCADDIECQSWLTTLQRCIATQCEAADQRHMATYWRHIREAQLSAGKPTNALNVPSLTMSIGPKSATTATDEVENTLGAAAGGQTFTGDVFGPAYALTIATQVLYLRAARKYISHRHNSMSPLLIQYMP
jgi:hypothetical protein